MHDFERDSSLNGFAAAWKYVAEQARTQWRAGRRGPHDMDVDFAEQEPQATAAGELACRFCAGADDLKIF